MKQKWVKRMMALLLAGVMVFSLTACGSSSSDDEEETEAEEEEAAEEILLLFRAQRQTPLS